MNYRETYKERLSRLVTGIENAVKDRKTNEHARYIHEMVTYDVGDRDQRIILIHLVTDAYAVAHAEVSQQNIDHWVAEGCRGERPSPTSLDCVLLDRLGDAILDEELTDTSRSKTYNEEYPFLSERQFERRRDREYSLTLADTYDLDGVNRAKPERRRRTAKEQRFVEKTARIKNRRRNAQYKRDTTAGALHTYKLRENGGELTEPFVAAASVGATWRERLSSVYEA
jgi:hypothetical protein